MKAQATIQELQSSKKVEEKLETGTRALGSTLMRQLKLLSRSKLLSKRQKLEKVLHLDHQWRSQESYKRILQRLSSRLAAGPTFTMAPNPRNEEEKKIEAPKLPKLHQLKPPKFHQ